MDFVHCATRIGAIVGLILSATDLCAQTAATQPANRLPPTANKPTPTTVPAGSQPVRNSTSRPIQPPSAPASQPTPEAQRDAAEKILDRAEKAGIKPKLEAMDFVSTSLDGDSVIVPNDYHGKLVLIM